jgi:hypothetical protein
MQKLLGNQERLIEGYHPSCRHYFSQPNLLLNGNVMLRLQWYLMHRKTKQQIQQI